MLKMDDIIFRALIVIKRLKQLDQHFGVKVARKNFLFQQ